MERKPVLRLSLWLLTFLFAFVQPLASMPVDSQTARKAATRFYNWKTGRSVEETYAQLVYTQQTNSHGTIVQTPPVTAFYVFDFGGQFVMVSADTRVIPVLAYSTESGFNADNLPENLGWFLDQYAQEIDFAVRTLSDQECQEAVSAWSRLLSGETPLMEVTASTVSPLLSTQWNQTNPYNSQCPADALGNGGHAHTGCVACAMAQIMRYWSYPVTGFGSHSYTCNFSSYGYGDYGTLSVDFSATTYNYDLMPSTLNGATQAQINEVAKLMYHCGVSVNMMYSPYGSGASDNSAVTAFRNYFGFDDAVLKYRSSYNATSWSALIKNELNNLRPVYYSGQGTGGHAFVCDGYDNQELFHFNWGWGGLYDGNFALTSLTPGSNNFSSDQVVIIGIEASQPKIHLETHNMSFLAEANSYSATKTITILGASLPDYIIATVSGNFRISNNGTNFYTARTVGSGGGTLHVRFQPTGTSGTETGFMVLQSGSIRDTVLLTGTIYDNTPHCLPPTNLRFSTQDLQNISIQWDAPTMEPDPHMLTWTTGNPSVYFGDTYSNYKKSMLQRFCDTDLVAYHNQALTAVSFIPDEDATLYKVVVYKGGGNNGDLNPGTLVLSQDINMSTLNSSTWNTITLNTPIVVDATQELWFGVYLEAPAGTFCMPLSSNSMPKKGCICGTHSPGSISWSELYENRTFCIRGTVENVQTVTNFQVSRNGTVVGTTTANNIEDHVTGTNTYTYVITANWSNGCSSSVQKSFTNIPGLFATPEVLDFYSNYGHGTVVKTTAVSGIGLSSAIQATVSGNFRISANGTSYSTSLTLPASGGTLYVKYTPTAIDNEYETGVVTLTSGNLTTNVSLSGQCFEECFPPQDLTLSQSGGNISLGWNAPPIPTTSQQDISWLSSVEGGFSLGAIIQHYFVHRFETTDIVSLHNKKLTAISFIPHQTATTYKVVVYQGGGPNGSYYFRSGTKVLEQSVDLSTLNNGTWNTIQLNQPVTIDASQELWFGIYMEAPNEGYPIRIGTPYVAQKGLIIKSAANNDNYWYEIGGGNFSYCFALKATVEDNPISLTHYQIDRNEEPVATTNNTSYTDHLFYNGEYDYDVWAVWSNGCKAAVRDGITVTGLCDHAGGTFTETACESYSWNGSTYNQSGEYFYTHYNNNGCPIVDTLLLTVHYGTHNTTTETACESFDWHGQTYTASGIYTYDYTNSDGCASTDTLHLIINHGTHHVETVVACDSYEWNGETYYESDVYIYEYTNNNGCASADTLFLTVNQSFNTSLSHVMCDGESFDFFNNTITSSGTYTETLQTVNGCDSVITLTMTVNDLSESSLDIDILENDLPFTLNGEQYSLPGLYQQTLTNAMGCDSFLTINLTIFYNKFTAFDTTVCDYCDWNGVEYTQSGEYTQMFTSADGSDSTVTMNLTVLHGTHDVFYETACESYEWHGHTYTTSGTYTFPYLNADGCASVDTLHLIVNPVFNTPIAAEICQGESYGFFGQSLTTTGTYKHTLQTVHGCDSVITLTLTVHPTFNTPITAEICQGETYSFFGQTLTTAGTYNHTLQTVHGCDSVITLTLIVNPVYNTPISQEICQGNHYNFFGQSLSVAGTYSHTLQSVKGCDSIVTLTLIVNDVLNTPISQEICQGETYNFFGQSLATAGTYTHTLQTVHGCDSVIMLTLTVNPTFNTPISAEICQGETYSFFGQALATTGTYTHTLQTVHGCDSVITLTLIVHPTFNTPITAEICQGETYNFFGQSLATAGTYNHTLQTIHGCDSVITLTLTVNPTFNTPITAEICQGETYSFFGQSLATAGTYNHTLQTIHGCDSVITLTLTVNPVYNTPISQEICQGNHYNFFGQTLSVAGTYSHTLQSVKGCDSIVTLTLIINDVLNTSITQDICEGETYKFFGQSLATAGTYTHTLQSVHGCDSVISLTLTVNPVFNTPIAAEICQGETYNFFGQTLATAGTYSNTLQSVHGCDSVITLTLIVHPTFNTPISAEICQGETYNFFGQSLTTAGTYNHTLESVHGCDSVITLTLTVNPIFNTPISAEICQGETYNFFGQTLATAGTYNHTLQTIHGCDSVITLTLTVNPTFNTPITAEICQGASYDFFGQSLTTAGTYNHTLQTIHGCDSVITLTLIVNPTFNTPISAEICQGESYSFFGQSLTTAGTYSHTLQTVHGCDSVITLTLTVNPVFNTPISAEICQGESYDFFGQTLTTAGTYSHTLQSVHGCDSVITLTLTVNPIFNTPISAEICQGETYDFFGQSLATAGTYNHTLESVHGCDSVITLTLTVNPIFNTPISAEICQGESYSFFGQSLTTAGTYNHTLQTVHGCDSIISLTLIVHPTFNTPITAEICQGETYDFFGQTLSMAGTYSHTLESVHGCDSVITLTLTVNPTFNTPISAEICQGESYSFFGQTLTSAGTYNHTLESIHGCDSVITLTLTVNPTFNTPISAEICQGETYSFFGQALTTAGTYNHTLESVHGCDSVITLTLIVRPTFNTPITAEICQGETYNFFGQSLATAGTYNHTLQTIHGCDSVITLTLTVNPVFNTPISAEICQGESYSFFGQTLTSAGTFTHTLQTVHGCDSVITLTLIVRPTFNTPVTAEICQGETYDFFGQSLSTAGTYNYTLESVHGCDSVITLTLIVRPTFNTPITAEICQGETYDFFGQSLSTAGTYNYTLESVHGCDSVITLTLIVRPTFNTPVNAEICQGETYDFFGQTLSTAGTYSHTLQTIHGCDSVITLTLTVNPVFNTPITAEICQGESYSFFGQSLTTAGTYNHTLQTVHGCDSVITLTLTVNPVFNTPISAEICQGESYSFFGQSLATAGTYNHTLQTIHGCDSVITLTLTVNPTFNTPVTAEICEGETYSFFGQTLATAGTYNHTLQTVHGCDSVITLTLTVNPTFNTPISAEICQGETYSFFGQTLSTAGTYTHTLESIHGCDSVITLTLIVHPTFNTPVTAEICQGETYDFFGQTLSTAGTYSHTLESVHGCDSVITLTLTVNPIFNTPVTAEICQGETYDFFGQTLSTAGTYNHTLQTIHGCDSVITLTLIVRPTFNTPVTAEICQGETYDFFGQTLTTEGTYTHTLETIHGCDSVITLTLTVNPTFNTPVTHTMCQGETYNFLGNILTTSGTYVDTLQTVNGCDSVVTLTLTVLNTDTTDFTEATCDSYTWNGETFTESGDYTVTLSNAAGCDSVVTLHLVINPSFDITVYDTAVRLHEYVLGDFQITPEEAGTFTYDLTGTTTAGCDSTVHLILTVLNNDGIPTNAMTGVEVFPNPTNATLNIKGENMRQIAIYNADGQLVYLKNEEIANLHRVDVSRYAAGQYLVKIIFDNKQSITKKIVVKH